MSMTNLSRGKTSNMEQITANDIQTLRTIRDKLTQQRAQLQEIAEKDMGAIDKRPLVQAMKHCVIMQQRVKEAINCYVDLVE